MLDQIERVNMFDKLTREANSYIADLASLFEAPVEIRPDYVADWCNTKEKLVKELDYIEKQLINNIAK